MRFSSFIVPLRLLKAALARGYIRGYFFLRQGGICRRGLDGGILAAVAKQERVRISERVQAGLARARKQGRIGGRPKAEDDHKLFQAVRRLRAAGKSIRQIASEADLSTNTVLKLLRAAEAA